MGEEAVAGQQVTVSPDPPPASAEQPPSADAVFLSPSFVIATLSLPRADAVFLSPSFVIATLPLPRADAVFLSPSSMIAALPLPRADAVFLSPSSMIAALPLPRADAAGARIAGLVLQDYPAEHVVGQGDVRERGLEGDLLTAGAGPMPGIPKMERREVG